MRYENKVVVITGGNSGIGLATAHRVKAEGAKVVIFGRNQKTLDEAAASLGDNVLAVQGDVANNADLDKLYAATKERFGSIDSLIVNAGIAQFSPVTEVTEEFFDKIFNINVKGAFFTVQKALPLMNDGGAIVLIASVVAQAGFGGTSVYAATKAALRNFARTMSTELLPRKIRVNSISPGPIATPIFDRMGLPAEAKDAMAEGFSAMVPQGRFGNSDEVASAIAFVGSSEASYILGTDLEVDGGMINLGPQGQG